MTLKQDLLELEVQTLDDRVRQDPKLMSNLLNNDFIEFGASGKVWSKPEILSALPSSPPLSEVEIKEFSVKQLGETHALATYKLSVRRGGVTVSSMRSSVWEYTENEWRILFHQGTPRQEQ